MPQPSAVPAVASLQDVAPARPGALREGAVAGLVAGLPMLGWLCSAAALEKIGWRQPLEAIGVAVTAWAPGGAAALIGLGLHAVTCAALGALFASLVPDDFPVTSSMTAGAGYGLFVTGIMMSAVVPVVGPEFRGLAQPVGGAWVVAHALYGAILGLVFLRLRRGTGHSPASGA